MVVIENAGNRASIEAGRWTSDNTTLARALRKLTRLYVAGIEYKKAYKGDVDYLIAQEMVRQLGGQIVKFERHKLPARAVA